MRPERLIRLISLSANGLRSAAAILFALIVAFAYRGGAAQATPQSSASPTYTSQSFAGELQRLKSGLDAAGKSTETLRAYRESLPASWSVDAAGRHFDVSTRQFSSRVQRAEQDTKTHDQQLEQAREYLDALAAEAASISAGPEQNEESARAKLNAILARPEYARNLRKTWWQTLQERINEILSDLLTRILSRVGGQKSFGYALLWIGICVAAILIAFWIFRQWSRRARGQEMALAAAAVPSLSWQEWIFAAREAGARADYRMAIHCAYWAAIARLQDLGSVTPDKAKTPREYLRALTRSKVLLPEPLSTRQQALSALTSSLEKTWYGYQTATEADFRDSLSQLETLECHLP